MLNVNKSDGSSFADSGGSSARFVESKGGTAGYMYASYGDIYEGLDPSFPYPDLPTAISTSNNVITITTMIPPTQNYGVFTADETRMMDEKFDDGNALTGKFFGANSRAVGWVLNTCSNAGVYVNNDKDLLCRAIFELGL